MDTSTARRGFLRGLTTLPLVGGSVALLGQPTEAAQPITPGLLATYSAWLWYERQSLMWASTRQGADAFIPHLNPGSSFHHRGPVDAALYGHDAQRRASVILAAAGCSLTSPQAEAAWGTTFRGGLAEAVQ